jgi:hypothetical protein
MMTSVRPRYHGNEPNLNDSMMETQTHDPTGIPWADFSQIHGIGIHGITVDFMECTFRVLFNPWRSMKPVARCWCQDQPVCESYNTLSAVRTREAHGAAEGAPFRLYVPSAQDDQTSLAMVPKMWVIAIPSPMKPWFIQGGAPVR